MDKRWLGWIKIYGYLQQKDFKKGRKIPCGGHGAKSFVRISLIFDLAARHDNALKFTTLDRPLYSEKLSRKNPTDVPVEIRPVIVGSLKIRGKGIDSRRRFSPRFAVSSSLTVTLKRKKESSESFSPACKNFKYTKQRLDSKSDQSNLNYHCIEQLQF